ncbi:heavy metal sensor histidine kinase [Pseudomonas profundi]|uniref:heavy metal sensor histidine kinase n=1 Tax=Pseudomonas profundi TaxID=1981513 RepID=UPI00123B63EB|nr:heavy metal sensor histidine kinase [Pseudomonas profundi]
MTKPLSLSLRIGLSISLLGSVLVILMFSQSWIMLHGQLENLADARLKQKLDQLVHAIGDSTPSSLSSLESHALADLVTGHPDLGLLACNASDPGQLVFSIGTIPLQVIGNGACSHNLATYQDRLQDAGISVQVRSATLEVGETGEEVTLVLLRNRSDDAELLDAFRDSTLLILPIFLMIIGLGAGWIARRGLAPLDRFKKLAEIVHTHDLKNRISPTGLPRELVELASSINVMLDRLESGVQQLSEFSDDLAHELRSPITNLMGKAQVALSRERTSVQYKETLESCVEELERITRIVSDMLYLAQTLQVETADLSEEIHLAHEAQHVVNLFSVMAEDKDIMLTVQGEGVILGNKLMVQRAISNLLSNAIRHASPCTNIPISISSEGRSIVVSVTNIGPGIPEEHLDAVFKRFYRVDRGRSRDEGGTGLGLSIVRLIMKSHQGCVTAESSEAGPTTFKLWFNLT